MMRSLVRTGWDSALARFTLAVLLFLTASGFLITFVGFHPAVQWSVLLHTGIGAVTLAPFCLYFVRLCLSEMSN